MVLMYLCYSVYTYICVLHMYMYVRMYVQEWLVLDLVFSSLVNPLRIACGHVSPIMPQSNLSTPPNSTTPSLPLRRNRQRILPRTLPPPPPLLPCLFPSLPPPPPPPLLLWLAKIGRRCHPVIQQPPPNLLQVRCAPHTRHAESRHVVYVYRFCRTQVKLCA